MINLEEHIVEIDGKKYIPYDNVVNMLNEAYNTPKLDDAFDNLNKAINDINNSINETLKDD